MKEASPYAISGSTGEELYKHAPLRWTRMLRFSIYFTVIGITLAMLKLRVALKAYGSSQATNLDAQVDDMNRTVEGVSSSILFALAFALLGATFIVISLIMRSREKKLRKNVVEQVAASDR